MTGCLPPFCLPPFPMTIATLLTSTDVVHIDLPCQVTALHEKTTKANKPYLDITFADGTAELKLKCWQDSVPYGYLQQWGAGAFVQLEGRFTKSEFGWESKFSIAQLADDEIEALLAGDPERRAFLDQRWLVLGGIVASLGDASLRTVTALLLTKHEGAFRRAGAARGNHHARRGGLLEHVTEMAESASAICAVYPHLNRSLLLAAVVFHDAGKILENQYEERGFTMPHHKGATLCGHIAIGFQLVRDLWIECGLDPADERLLFLRHCILSHHGQLDWGSPVEPHCPEAAVLHYLDQISAKIEMFKAGLALPEVAPGLHERGYPMRISAANTPPEQP